MEVDELTVGEPSSEDVRQSKSPLEKMRVRLAAENSNKPNSYQTMRDDCSDDEHANGACAVFHTLYTYFLQKYTFIVQYRHQLDIE